MLSVIIKRRRGRARKLQLSSSTWRGEAPVVVTRKGIVNGQALIVASRWALSLALSFYLSLQVGTREAREEEREETVQEDCSRSSLFYYKMRHSTNALWRQSNEQLFFFTFRVCVSFFFTYPFTLFLYFSLSHSLSFSPFLSFSFVPSSSVAYTSIHSFFLASLQYHSSVAHWVSHACSFMHTQSLIAAKNSRIRVYVHTWLHYIRQYNPSFISVLTLGVI